MYRFTEWPDWKLEERLADVEATQRLPHNPERRGQIAREHLHLSFEIGQRLLPPVVTVELPESQNV